MGSKMVGPVTGFLVEGDKCWQFGPDAKPSDRFRTKYDMTEVSVVSTIERYSCPYLLLR